MFSSGKPKPHRVRPATRYSTDGFKTQDGEVADVSRTGMRIRLTSKPSFVVGEIRDFVISSAGQAIKVPGQVVWVKRKTMFTKDFEAGIHFVDLREGLRKVIEEFAINGVLPQASPFPSSSRSSKRPRVRVEGPDFYALLGVGRVAKLEEIHEAYRQLAKQLHPDLNKEADAADRFRSVTEAYRVLKNQNLRNQYDLSLHAA